jgi:hypothetical protein
MALQPFVGPWSLLQFRYLYYEYIDSRNPWTSDQPVARPLPKHRTTQTQNKYIHISNIHVLCGIRTHDPSFQAREDSTCLRPLGYRDRPLTKCYKILSSIGVCAWLTRRVLDWMIGFIDNLFTQLGTTGITALSLFPHVTHELWFSLFTSCIMATDFNCFTVTWNNTWSLACTT